MEQPQKPRDFLTPKEAAAAFKISLRVMYDYLRDGTGPKHTRKNRVIRIPIEEFNRWTTPSKKGR